MSAQEIIVGIFFIAALLYIFRIAYKNFSLKSVCAKGCGGACNTFNADALEKKIRGAKEK